MYSDLYWAMTKDYFTINRYTEVFYHIPVYATIVIKISFKTGFVVELHVWVKNL